MDQFDDKKIREFIKAKQKENRLPGGRIKIQNVESLANKYKIFRCKITPFMKKPRYLNIQEDKDNNFKLVISDEWNDFNF